MKKLLLLLILFLSACSPSKQITITFKSNADIEYSDIITSKNEVIILPKPSREGYSFAGWQADSLYNDEASFTKDTILYAKWDINYYEVIFVDYDEAIISKQSIRHKSSPTPPQDPIREGYSFIAWDQDFNKITSNVIIKAFYEEASIGLEFSLEDDFYTISGYSGKTSDVIIPSIYKGLAVRKIASRAFYENFDIKSIRLANTLIEIDDEAFYNCLNLEEINLENVSMRIGKNAFYSCEKLNEISLAAKLIDEASFHSCTSLENINILDSVENIAYGAFYNCSSLTTIFMPSSVTSIGDHLFSWSRKLTTVLTPNSNLSRLREMFNNINQIYLHADFHIASLD